MTRIIIYQSEAWHNFHTHQDKWLNRESTVVIPDYVSKQNVAKAFAYVQIDAIFTIPELIALYLQNHGGKGLILPHVMESIIGSIMTEEFVPYLKMQNYRQGYIRALTEFICNFRSTSLLDLETALSRFKTESFSFKEKDLIKIYAEYEKKLPDFGFDLRSGLSEFLINTNSDNIYPNLGIGATRHIVFLGFDYLSPLEIEFIYAVFKYVHQAGFLFCADAAASDQAMYIQGSITRLLKRLKTLDGQHKILPPSHQNFFSELSINIFKAGPSVNIKTRDRTVAIFQANSRFQEVISIARQIKELIETGTAPDKIRIAAPAYTLYSSIIEEVFPGYHLPFTLEKGVPLLRFPLAKLILHLVNQGVSQNRYHLREKILSSQYVSFCEEVLPQDLEKYQRDMGVQLLPQEKLEQSIKPGIYRLDYNFLKNIRRESYRTVKPVAGIPQIEVVKRYVKGLSWKNDTEKDFRLGHCLIQFYLLARVEKVLSSWQAKMSATEFKNVVQQMLHHLHIAKNIESLGAASQMLNIRARDGAVLTRVNLLLEEMEVSLAAAKQSPAGKFTLTELAHIFARLMDDASLFSEEYAPGADTGIAIQPILWGQYENWEYTFICGMVDGEFPAKESFNFLQPKKEGLGLGQTYTSVDYGRNRFYQLIRSTSNALFLSHPLSDNGKRLAPSPFIKEIERCIAAGFSARDTAEIAASRDKLYSRREKLLFMGKNVDHHYEKVQPLLKELMNEDEIVFNNIVEIMRFDGLTLAATGFSEFDGLFCQETCTVEPSTGLPLAMLKERVSNIAFTPAVLERYAACPMRFFFDDILSLKLEPDFEPDTTETGILVRSILKEYTDKACKAKKVPDNAPLFFLEAVNRHLKEREEEGMDAFHARFLNGLAAGLGQQEGKRRGLLYAFLQYEQNGPDFLSPYLPQQAGVIKLDQGLNIQVEIDRVDLAGATGYLLPLLYTMAGTRDPVKLRRGLQFDLPLAILLCMDYIAAKKIDRNVGGAGQYQVKTAKAIKRSSYFALECLRGKRQTDTSPGQPVFSGQREGFVSEGEFYQALDKIQGHIRFLYRLMQKGIFHLPLCLAKEQSCPNCSFGRLCRKDQLRLEKLKNNIKDDSLTAEEVYLVRNIF